MDATDAEVAERLARIEAQLSELLGALQRWLPEIERVMASPMRALWNRRP